MKTFIMSSILLLATAGAHAGQPRFISSDDSALSAMCIAATQSGAAFREAAKQHGLDSSEFDTLYCNGMPLDRFVGKYRAREEPKPRRLVFSQQDDTPLTRLCVAALSSNETYRQVKQQYFADDAAVGDELKCNGMPVKSFVRRYRSDDRDFTASIE